MQSKIYSLASNVNFCVFDEATKAELLYMAHDTGKPVLPRQITVTGPPVDQRIVSCRHHKNTNKYFQDLAKRPLHLAITTGGIGSNKQEIKSILEQLATFCFTSKNKSCTKLLLYASTNQDFRALYQAFAKRAGLKPGKLDNPNAKVRILYSDNIVKANDLLIKYMFPWADGIITKPSGDMAYDAAAAGCFTLFLEPLGPWEQNIQDRFIKLKIGADLKVPHFKQELHHFYQKRWQGKSWFKKAIQNTLTLPPLFTKGSQNIISTYTQFTHQKQ